MNLERRDVAHRERPSQSEGCRGLSASLVGECRPWSCSAFARMFDTQEYQYSQPITGLIVIVGSVVSSGENVSDAMQVCNLTTSNQVDELLRRCRCRRTRFTHLPSLILAPRTRSACPRRLLWLSYARPSTPSRRSRLPTRSSSSKARPSLCPRTMKPSPRCSLLAAKSS